MKINIKSWQGAVLYKAIHSIQWFGMSYVEESAQRVWMAPTELSAQTQFPYNAQKV